MAVLQDRYYCSHCEQKGKQNISDKWETCSRLHNWQRQDPQSPPNHLPFCSQASFLFWLSSRMQTPQLDSLVLFHELNRSVLFPGLRRPQHTFPTNAKESGWGADLPTRRTCFLGGPRGIALLAPRSVRTARWTISYPESPCSHSTGCKTILYDYLTR